MAAEGAPPRADEVAQDQQPPFCSSALCRALSPVPFIVAGAFLLRTVRNAVDGQSERLRKPTVFARMGLGLCLISWGVTLFIYVPKKTRDP